MATAHDVADFILAKLGAMSAMKLQKLVYYSQAWHLTWAEKPLFENQILRMSCRCFTTTSR